MEESLKSKTVFLTPQFVLMKKVLPIAEVAIRILKALMFVIGKKKKSKSETNQDEAGKTATIA
jgi:hypothetical protein